MSYCPNCGRQILDESLGCPVCNVRNNIDPTKKPVPTEQTDEYKEGNSFREEAKAEQAETVDSFTVEEADGKTHHFETNEETGDAEYKKKNTVDADAKIPTAIKVLVIVLIVAVGGLGAIAGGAETFFGKNKAKSMEGKLALATKVSAGVFIICALIVAMIG